MMLNKVGEIASDEWLKTAKIRQSISLYPDEMVVMPDHIHGIIRINEVDAAKCKGAASLCPYKQILGIIVRAYKAGVTYHINAARNSHGIPVWHRNYYDKIIRNEAVLWKIWAYIETDPQRWGEDRYHTE